MDDLLGNALGRNLTAFRTAEGQTRAEFAAKLGIDVGYLEGLERGEVDPDLATVETLASKIGMDPVLLLEETRGADRRSGA